MKQNENTKLMKLNSKYMIISNDNNYNNPYEENNDNKIKFKEWITKIIKVQLLCVVIKDNDSRNYEKINSNYNIMIITVIIINNSNL